MTPSNLLEIIDGIMDEADQSDNVHHVYTERQFILASAWGVIAVARSYDDPGLLEAIFTAHPELVHE